MPGMIQCNCENKPINVGPKWITWGPMRIKRTDIVNCKVTEHGDVRIGRKSSSIPFLCLTENAFHAQDVIFRSIK